MGARRKKSSPSKPTASPVAVAFLSRGKRKRLETKERRFRKANLVGYLAATATNAKKVKEHGAALGDLSELTGVLEEMERAVDAVKEEAKFVALKKELNKVTLNRKQCVKDETRGLASYDELMGTQEFVADPWGYCRTRLAEAAERRSIRLKQFEELKAARRQPPRELPI